MLKYILIALGVAIILIGSVFFLLFNATSGLTETADNFFNALSQKDYKKAYSFLSREFQTKTSPEDLQQRYMNSEIKNFSSANWHNRSFENNIGKLEGYIKTSTGGTIPINLGLVKENDVWKINSIDKLESGFMNSRDFKEPKIPDDIQLKQMTREIILALGNSINNKDFSEFFSIISYTWQKQTKPEELRKAFISFEENNINLTDFANKAEPVFDKVPAIGEDELLVLSGSFPLQFVRLRFNMKFIYEHPKWKLISINIKTE